jgi:hypothetical protein
MREGRGRRTAVDGIRVEVEGGAGGDIVALPHDVLANRLTRRRNPERVIVPVDLLHQRRHVVVVVVLDVVKLGQGLAAKNRLEGLALDLGILGQRSDTPQLGVRHVPIYQFGSESHKVYNAMWLTDAGGNHGARKRDVLVMSELVLLVLQHDLHGAVVELAVGEALLAESDELVQGLVTAPGSNQSVVEHRLLGDESPLEPRQVVACTTVNGPEAV